MLSVQLADTTHVDTVGRALNPTELSVICWSLCVLQQYNTPFFRECWEELADCWAHEKFTLTPQWCSQVYQVTVRHLR